jgi:hypothetical protein
LTCFLLTHVLPAGPVALVGDDSVDGDLGPQVYGKARHLEEVHSSHSFIAWYVVVIHSIPI